jgi:hypothetical protein
MRAIRSIFISGVILIAGAASGARRVCAQEPGGAAGRSGQSEASLAGGIAILAELNGGLDAKKAKVGEAVSAHTIETVKSADARTILPKGTKIIGHLAQAMARSKGDGESVLGIAFDKAILKDGGEVELNVRVQAIAEPVAFSGGGATDLSHVGTTRTSPMSGSQGGAAAGSGTAGGANEAVAEPIPNSGVKLGPNSRGVLGLKGLKLAAARSDGKVVSNVSSDGKNVRLDSGTRFLLVTIQAAEAGQ